MAATHVFKVQIDDDMETEVLESFVQLHGYKKIIAGKSNPESVEEAANRLIAAFIKESFKAYTVKITTDQARDSAEEEAKAVVVEEVKTK